MSALDTVRELADAACQLNNPWPSEESLIDAGLHPVDARLIHELRPVLIVEMLATPSSDEGEPPR